MGRIYRSIFPMKQARARATNRLKGLKAGYVFLSSQSKSQSPGQNTVQTTRARIDRVLFMSLASKNNSPDRKSAQTNRGIIYGFILLVKTRQSPGRKSVQKTRSLIPCFIFPINNHKPGPKIGSTNPAGYIA